MKTICSILALLLVLAPARISAQRMLSPRTDGSLRVESAGYRERKALRPGGIRPIAVAKWSTLIGAAGAAAYGFIRNDQADDLYRDLELACNADRAVCGLRTSDGAYADPQLEAMYQDVLDRDRTSQRALIASQVGVAIGVVLFLLDLRSDDRPEDIPYEPRRIELAPARGGGLTLSATLRVGF